MNTDKLKLIVKNLESLVDCLKSEVYSEENSNSYLNYEEIAHHISDYDEIFEDIDLSDYK